MSGVRAGYRYGRQVDCVPLMPGVSLMQDASGYYTSNGVPYCKERIEGNVLSLGALGGAIAAGVIAKRKSKLAGLGVGAAAAVVVVGAAYWSHSQEGKESAEGLPYCGEGYLPGWTYTLLFPVPGMLSYLVTPRPGRGK